MATNRLPYALTRYKAIGNSMAVPVVAWIFDRLDHVRQVVARAP